MRKDKIKEKVLNKYSRNIAKFIKNKYKKISLKEAKEKKIYLDSSQNMRKNINEIAKNIYETYLPIIEQETSMKIEEFVLSEEFQKAILNEEKLSKRSLSYKNLKQYKKFPINIPSSFIDLMYDEVNKDISEPNIPKDEIKYILLLILYKIIQSIVNGIKIKIGTFAYIWCDIRDIRVNLPDVKNRILSNRFVPKIKLCRKFDYDLFKEINKDNDAIMNYYKAKVDRFLMLLKIKNRSKNGNN